MKEIKKFDENIWADLLRARKSNPKVITRRWIAKTYRLSDRMASGYYFALKNAPHIVNDVQLAKEIFKHKSELLKLRRLTKEQAREIADIEKAFNFLTALNNKSITKGKINPPVNSITSKATAIALFGDVHPEEIIRKGVMSGLNEYNLSIATERIKKYFARLLFMIRSSRNTYDIDTLVFAVLGDLINGYIHEEFEENNSLSPIEASIFIRDLLYEGIDYLLRYGEFKEIIIPMVRGNHGRTTKRKRFSTGYKNSYEWLVYNDIENRFKRDVVRDKYDTKLTFYIPESEFALIDIYNKTWCFSHGDHFSYRGGVGGIMVPFMGWMKKMRNVLPADKYAIAHWHTTVNLPMGVINGSIIGYSPYAFGKALEPEEPQQSLFIQDSKRGIVRTDPIILTDW